MSAFVTGFKYDVFVSYAHVDNCKFGESTGWVETLVELLREALPQKLGRSEANIWRDPCLSGSEPFSEALQDAVTGSATLLVILSKNYLSSEWCRKELELFLESAAHNGGAKGRLFLVRLDALQHQDWPDAFEGLLGHQFYEQANVDARLHTLGTLAADDPDKLQYFQQLDDLRGELAKKLLQLKAESTPPKLPDSSSDPIPTDDAPAVFLAEVTPDLDELRDNVRRYLQQAKLRVFPATYYDRTPANYRSAAEIDLDQSLLFVQLLGPYVGPKPADLPKGYAGLQLDIAEEKGIPTLRWHDPELDSASIKDQQLLARTEVMIMGLEAFKREIVTQIKKRQVAQQLPLMNGEAFVLVNANSLDESVAETIRQSFDQQGIGYDTIDENEDIETLLEECDVHGLMVVYGQCQQQWAKQQVRICRKLLLKKKQQAPVCAVYIGPPDDKPALGIRLPQVPLLTHQDPNPFSDFLSAIQEKLENS